jgi:peptide/nickel transport system substrate-binding protein
LFLMKIRDRALVGSLAVALIVLSILALAPSLHSSDSSAEPSPSTTTGHHYVEGMLGRATNASPFGARSPADRELVSLLFRGLVHLGPGNALTGDLASRWEVDPTGRIWTFHLRDGLHWQDGEPITADDVAFTVDVLSNPDYTGPGAESWRDVTATVVDPQTVQLALSTPLGGFLQAATQPIAPAHLLDGIAPDALPDDPFGQDPIGSGPFRLVLLDPGHAILAAATPIDASPPDEGGGPNFSTPAPTDSLATAPPTRKPDVAVPYLSTFELRFFDDPDTLRLAWNRGDLDAASGLQPADATALAATPGARLVVYPSSTLLAVTFNLRAGRPEFADPAVRKALLQAIDRDQIVASTMDHLGMRADSLVPPGSPMFDPTVNPTVAFDPTAAKKGLIAAGWKQSGSSWIPKGAKDPLILDLYSPEETANPVAYATAAAVVDGWHAIGLAVRQVPLPASELINDHLGQGNFEVAVVPFAIGLDPDLYPLLAASQTRSGGSNIIGLQDPDLDKLLVAARTPVDVATRAAKYSALEARLSARDYLLPLAFRDDYVVFRDTVVGPEPRLVGASGDRYWDVLTWRLADGS